MEIFQIVSIALCVVMFAFLLFQRAQGSLGGD